jgi:hypothetical protein
VSYRTQENSKQHNHKGSDKVSYLPGAFIPGSGYIAGPECDKCAGMGVVEQPDGTAVECECKRAAS